MWKEGECGGECADVAALVLPQWPDKIVAKRVLHRGDTTEHQLAARLDKGSDQETLEDVE